MSERVIERERAMGFTTPFFLFVFFPFSLLLYYLAVVLEKIRFFSRLRLKDFALLGVSLLFFGWGMLRDIWFLMIYFLVVYAAGLLIEKMPGKRAAAVLAVVTTLLLVILYQYRYQHVAAEYLNRIAGRTVMKPNGLIPLLGISFLTFSAISYMADVRRGLCPRGDLLDVALYLSFFPKIISGPIVLWRDFQPQLSNRNFSTGCFVSGLNRLMIGFAKKVIIADTLGAACAEIGADGIDVLTAWGSAFLYMLEIYYDFSGYSDIAIGLGRMLGFDIKENFDFPYVSRSIAEFWRRWHISLGAWFREYVYIPLGGNRRGKKRALLNLAVVFLLTGLWHGEGVCYILWGVLHGACRLTEKSLEGTSLYRRVPELIKYLLTMLVVMIGWQVFRFESTSSVIRLLQSMLALAPRTWIKYSFSYYFNPEIITLMVIASLGAVVPAIPIIRQLPRQLAENRAWFAAQEIGLTVLMAASVIYMINSSYTPFIYFGY